MKCPLGRFTYDGQGPAGVRFSLLPAFGGRGSLRDYDIRGLDVLNVSGLTDGSPTDLPKLANANLSLTSPVDVANVSRLAVWCPEFGVAFGRVDLDEARSEGLTPPPPPVKVGPFLATEHGVAGTVFVQDDNTLLIRDFSYDGRVGEEYSDT